VEDELCDLPPIRPDALGIQQPEVGDNVLFVIAGQDRVRRGGVGNWRIDRRELSSPKWSAPRRSRRAAGGLAEQHDAAAAVGLDEQDATRFQSPPHLIARRLMHRKAALGLQRFIAVSATTAFSASISCVQFSKARAARTCRPVTIHDHLRHRTAAHQETTYLFGSCRSSIRVLPLARGAPRPLRLASLPGLMLARCEPEVRADGPGPGKARRHIEGRSKGESDERPNTRNSHEASADRIFASKADEQVIKLGEPISERSADCQQRIHDHHEIGIAGEFADTSFEVSSDDFA
jgi:hypothetical protein